MHGAAVSWLRSVAVAVKEMSVACCDMSITTFASNTWNTKISVTLNLVKILCNHKVTQYFRTSSAIDCKILLIETAQQSVVWKKKNNVFLFAEVVVLVVVVEKENLVSTDSNSALDHAF